MSEKIIVIISILAVFNLMLISISSWIKTKKYPVFLWLGCIFFSAAVAIFNNLTIHLNHGNIIIYHIAQLLNIPFGGYLISFVSSLRKRNDKVNLDWKPFIPVLLYIPFIVLCIIQPQWANTTIEFASRGRMTIFSQWYNMIIVVYSIGTNSVLFINEFNSKSKIHGENHKTSKERKEVLFVMLFLQLAAFIPFILKFNLEYIILYMPVFGQIFFLYIFFRLSRTSTLIYEEYSTPTMTIEPVVKYAAIRIEHEKANEIQKRVSELIITEKPFLRMDYTLAEMAKDLNVPTNILSMVINSKFNTTFPDFINSYRVKYAIGLLSDFEKKNLTIESIAYDSGFNNRTSFYAAFKKHTGKLPSEYIKKNRENLSVG